MTLRTKAYNAAAAIASVYPLPIVVFAVILLYTAGPILLLSILYRPLFWLIPRLAIVIFGAPFLVGLANLTANTLLRYIKRALDFCRIYWLDLLLAPIELFLKATWKMLQWAIIGVILLLHDMLRSNYRIYRGLGILGYHVFRHPAIYIAMSIAYTLGGVCLIAAMAGKFGAGVLVELGLFILYIVGSAPEYAKQKRALMRKGAIWLMMTFEQAYILTRDDIKAWAKEYFTEIIKGSSRPCATLAHHYFMLAIWDVRTHLLLHMIFGLVTFWFFGFDENKNVHKRGGWQNTGLEWHTFLSGVAYSILNLARHYTLLCAGPKKVTVKEMGEMTQQPPKEAKKKKIFWSKIKTIEEMVAAMKQFVGNTTYLHTIVGTQPGESLVHRIVSAGDNGLINLQEEYVLFEEYLDILWDEAGGRQHWKNHPLFKNPDWLEEFEKNLPGNNPPIVKPVEKFEHSDGYESSEGDADFDPLEESEPGIYHDMRPYSKKKRKFTSASEYWNVRIALRGKRVDQAVARCNFSDFPLPQLEECDHACCNADNELGIHLCTYDMWHFVVYEYMQRPEKIIEPELMFFAHRIAPVQNWDVEADEATKARVFADIVLKMCDDYKRFRRTEGFIKQGPRKGRTYKGPYYAIAEDVAFELGLDPHQRRRWYHEVI